METVRGKWIGRSVHRKEDTRLLQGAGQFADDNVAPGELYCALARSTNAHARIVGVDTARAEALPGVVAVVTGEQARPHWTPFPSGIFGTFEDRHTDATRWRSTR